MDARADPAAFYFTGRFQLFDDRPGQCRGNGKSDTDRTAGRRKDRRVDADHLAGEVEHWATGIAAVDGGVRLQKVVVRPGMDVPRCGGNDTRGYRAAETKR